MHQNMFLEECIERGVWDGMYFEKQWGWMYVRGDNLVLFGESDELMEREAYAMNDKLRLGSEAEVWGGVVEVWGGWGLLD